MMRRQQGVALITIMLIVAVATILAVRMASDQNLAVHRAASLFNNAQAMEYAYGGEELARQILFASFKKEPTRTTLSQDWASDALDYDYDQGHIQLRIIDLQSRLNVNDLAASSTVGLAVKGYFVGLFTHLGIEPMFLDRIVDWVDADQARQPMGAEDYNYLGLDPPYRAANRPMADITELRLLLGMDSKHFVTIAPYLAVLPEAASTVNVNTAPAEVLQAIAPGLGSDQAESIVSARSTQEGGFDTQQAFVQDVLRQSSASRINVAGLGVQSSFFEVDVRAQYRGHFAYLTSIIQRDPSNGSMRVIYRNLSRKIVPVVAQDQSSGKNNG